MEQNSTRYTLYISKSNMSINGGKAKKRIGTRKSKKNKKSKKYGKRNNKLIKFQKKTSIRIGLSFMYSQGLGTSPNPF